MLTELLSDPKLPKSVAQYLSELPLIEIQPGYWERAGALRAKVLAKQRKARLGDALTAQSCLDRGVPLLTRDRDFHAFAECAELSLAIGSGRYRKREAAASALPKPRKTTKRQRFNLIAAAAFIDQVLELDKRAPRKQRHTTRRIYERLRGVAGMPHQGENRAAVRP